MLEAVVLDLAVFETVAVFDLELDIEFDDKFDVEFAVEFDILLVDMFEFVTVMFVLDRFAFAFELFAGDEPQPKLTTKSAKTISTRIIDLNLLYLPDYPCCKLWRNCESKYIPGAFKVKAI